MSLTLSLIAVAQLTGAAFALPTFDQPQRSGTRAPGDAAVIIGLEDYAFVPPVPYAKRDAHAVYDLLVYTRGIPTSNVRLLEAGGREQIVAAVEDAAKLVGPNGTLWVYFAGHGAASAGDGKRLLLGDDVRQDPSAFDARAVSLDEITAIAGTRPVRLLIDACYSGMGRAGAEIAPGKRFAVPSYAQPVTGDQLFWTAASGDQLSGPLDPAQHGAFTYLMVGAMRGWADGQIDGKRDGKVTAEEADLFVRAGLRTLQITNQTPTLESTSASSVVLSSGRLESTPELKLVRSAPSAPSPPSREVQPPEEAPIARPRAGGGGGGARAGGDQVVGRDIPADPRNKAEVRQVLNRIVSECRSLNEGGAHVNWSIRAAVKKGQSKGINISAGLGGMAVMFSPSGQGRLRCITSSVRTTVWAQRANGRPIPNTRISATVDERRVK